MKTKLTFFRVLGLGLLLHGSPAMLMAEATSDPAVYQRRVDAAEPMYLLELLREYAAREEQPFAKLTELYVNPPLEGVRETLLDLVQVDFIREEKWLEKVALAGMSGRQRRVLWKRGRREEEFREKLELLKLSREIFPSAAAEEQRLIIPLHRADRSPALLDALPAKSFWTSHALMLEYAWSSGLELVLEDLTHSGQDDEALAQVKIKCLREKKAFEGLAGYNTSPIASVRCAALEGQGETRYREALKDDSAWVRAGAVGMILEKSWDAALVEKITRENSWVELEAALKGMQKHEQQIHVEWMKTVWLAACREGRFTLAEFMVRFQRPEWWSLLMDRVENEPADRDIVLGQFLFMKPMEKSDWLLKLLEKKSFESSHTAAAFKALYTWKEKLDGNRYSAIFRENGYDKGGPGGEYLLKLVGMMKADDAYDIIREHLRSYLTNPYASEAIEAAGWNGDPRFEKILLAKFGTSVDEIKDPIGRWSILRCQGEELTLPEVAKSVVRRARLSYRILE